MRKIELASWKDVPRRLASLRKTLEMIYEVKLGVDLEDVPIDRLHPTESFLEKDKLAVVFMKVLTEDYDVTYNSCKTCGRLFCSLWSPEIFYFKETDEEDCKSLCSEISQVQKLSGCS